MRWHEREIKEKKELIETYQSSAFYTSSTMKKDLDKKISTIP